MDKRSSLVAKSDRSGVVVASPVTRNLELGSFSSSVRRVRLVTAAGDVREVGESEPELLHAAQLTVGMLGVVTELELEVAPLTGFASELSTGATRKRRRTSPS
jgi:hypothetical protein